MPSPRSSPLAALALGLIVSAGTATAQAPNPETPAGLARLIPATDLTVLVEFDGLDAHEAAWRKSAAYRLLNRTKLGPMLEALATQGLDRALASIPPALELKSADVLGALKDAIRGGFAFGIDARPGRRGGAVIVLGQGVKNGTRALIERLLTAAGAPIKSETKGERTLTVLGDGDEVGGWWNGGDDLVIALPPLANLERAIDVSEGKARSAADHPIRAELRRPGQSFEPALIGFVDVSALGFPPSAAKVGLDGLKRLDYAWGFQDDALYSVLRVVAPAPRRGVLALLDDPGFAKGSPPAVPVGATDWTAVSFRPLAFYDKIVALSKANDPKAGAQIAEVEAKVKEATGARLREDILGPIGPGFVSSMNLAAAGLGGNGEITLEVDVRDGAAFAKILAPMVDRLNDRIKAEAAANPGSKGAVQFKRVDGPMPGYTMVVPPQMLAQVPMPIGKIEPTLMIGPDRMALALTADRARKAVTDRTAWVAPPAYRGAIGAMPERMMLLSVGDPSSTLPTAIATTPMALLALNAQLAQAPRAPGQDAFQLRIDPAQVPTPAEIKAHLFPGSSAATVDAAGLTIVQREAVPTFSSPATSAVAVALLLPAVQAAREAARRTQCVNDLKQIGLALHNHHAANNQFPAAAICDADGKPLLSWRVAMLPYIEQQELYNEFKLDEPWDSPNNKPLIAKMPRTYACPSCRNLAPGMTTFKALVGGGALLELDRPTPIAAVTDGTSNTVAVVETRDPVIWTKPDDIAFDPEAEPSFHGAASDHPGGFNALFTDGSVRFIKMTIDRGLWKRLITRAGGEVIQAGRY